VKKTSLFLVFMLIALLGAGTASFAKCTATTFPTGNGIWGFETAGLASGNYYNSLFQVTFVSGGTFSGTEWDSNAGTISGPTAVSGTWSATTLAGCEYTMKVTSPSTQTFNFTLNNGGKNGIIVQIDAGYTTVGQMAEQGTVTCSSATFKSKQFSLYSQGYIPSVGGLVTGTGELLFDKTGTIISGDSTVTLDLGGAGNLVLPASGSATLGANCQGSSVLTTPAGSFDSDTVVVDEGKESFFLVTNAGDNVSGYLLE
jgi:hypothetical protein